MSSGSTAQDPAWKSKENAHEAQFIREKEQAQLAALKEELDKKSTTGSTVDSKTTQKTTENHGYEGGFGGQEDLIDKYATTSGEH